MRILDLGTDLVPVGGSVTLDDLMAPTSQPVQQGFEVSPGQNPADQDRITPERNAQRIDQLEKQVRELTDDLRIAKAALAALLPAKNPN